MRFSVWTRLSKTEPGPELKGARAARAEHLREARSGLTKRGAGDVATVAGKVGGVVDVEGLSDEQQMSFFGKDKIPTQLKIKRLRIVSKRVMLRQCEPRDWCAFSIKPAGKGLVELVDQVL